MRNRYLILIFFVLLSLSGFSQLKYNRIYDFPIIENDDTLKFAWAGGLNNPQFNEIDLNFDGLKDLFIYEKEGGIIKTFINDGVPGESSYSYTTKYQNRFPELKNFALLRDYNCDGKMDIFTGATGGLKVYKNISSVSLGIQFELITSLLLSDYNPNVLNLYVPSTDIPVIDDLDNDGDLDILTFGVVGSTVEHHENLSVDLYGICDSLSYRLANTCWGNFSENSMDNGVTLGISCKGGSFHIDESEDKRSRHSGSTLLTIDLDADGDKEFISGDISFNNLVMLTNGGDSITANMIAEDNQFPLSTAPVDLPIFPAGFYLDVNNDSIKDLIVAPTAKNVSENVESTWLYTNSGKNNFPDFSFTTGGFLQNEMMEAGSGSNPIFFDANSDGLMDIIVGNFGYYQENDGLFKSRLMLMENIGTNTNPSFEIITDDWQNTSTIQKNGFYPAFGDMDNDGDQDMILGEANGIINYYENISGAGNPVNFTSPILNYMSIDIGYFAAPFIIDYNKDGLNDLIIGERAGTLKYFENKGTAEEASYEEDPTIDTLAGIDVMTQCCTGYSNVHARFDNDDILTLFVGSEKGIIYQYQSTDNTLSDYQLVDSIITTGKRVNSSFADIDGNNEKEFVSGHYTGGISLYSKTSSLRLVSPSNGTTNLNDTLTLDWSSVEATEYYQVVLDTTYNFNSPIIIDSIIPFINDEGNGLDTQLDVVNILDGTKYYWKARLLAGTEFSEWSELWSFNTAMSGDINLNGVIDSTETTGDSNGNGVIDIGEIHGDINGNGVIDGYDLSGDTDGNGIIDGNEISGDLNNNGVIDSNEIAGDSNGNGIIDDAEIIGDINGNGFIDNNEIKGDLNGNGILDEAEISSINFAENINFTFYPNPTSGILTIELNSNISDCYFSLFNIQGQSILSKKLSKQKNTINLSAISNGIYFGSISSADKKTEVFKVVKE